MQIWLLAFGAVALTARLGMTVSVVGGCRAKNGVGQVGRTLTDVAAAVLAFWAIGAALLLSAAADTQAHYWLNTVISIDRTLLFSQVGGRAAAAFFHLTAVLIAGGIVTAVLAERGSAAAGVIGAVVVAGFVVPVAGCWAWSGWLANQHFVDVGGSTVLHLSGAVVAAVAAATVGSRAGKYGVNRAPASIAGHALPLLGVGALMVAVGYVPFLLGSVVAHAATNGAIDDWPSALGTAGTNALLAAAGGIAGGSAYAHLRFGKPDLFFAVAGLLGGLVAVSAGVIALGNVGALGVGLGAGLLVPMAAGAINGRVKLDDPLGAIAIHGVGGLWGTLAVPLLSPRRTGGDLGAELADRLRLLAVQLAGATAVVVLAAVAAGVAFGLLRSVVRLRMTTADEADGQDRAEFGVVAYPEFGKADAT